MKKRNVRYERCLIVHIDILGFRQKIANHISRCILMITEAVEPGRPRGQKSFSRCRAVAPPTFPRAPTPFCTDCTQTASL